MLVETRHPAHAKELVAALPVHELELYDGILAVCPCLALTKLKLWYCFIEEARAQGSALHTCCELPSPSAVLPSGAALETSPDLMAGSLESCHSLCSL